MSRRCIHSPGRGLSLLAMALGLLLTDGSLFASLGLYADNDRLWIFQVREDDAGQPMLRLAYRPLSAPTGRDFRPFPIGSVLGRPRLVAAAGDGLHIFFNDGTHRRYYLMTTPTGAAMSAGQSIERSFPNASLPVALAADDRNDLLFALISGRQLLQLESDRVALEALTVDKDDDVDASSGLAADPSRHFRRDQLNARVMVRYVEGDWVFDRPAPADMTLEDRVLALAVQDQAMHLLYRRDEADEHALLRHSPHAEAGWGQAIETDIAHGSCAWWLEQLDGSLMLCETVKDGDAYSVSVRALANNRWRVAAQLLDAEGQEPRWSQPPALTVTPAGIIIASIDGLGEPRVQRWSIDGGSPIETLAPIRALSAPSAPAIDPSLSWVVEYALLAVVLMVIFVGRRERVLFAAPLKPAQAFANLPRRALAFAVDMVILTPVFFLVFMLWFGRDQLAAWMQWDIQNFRDESLARKEQWFRDILGLVVGLYAIPFEIWLGATPGKRLTGCFVADERGERCTISRIIIRNLVRAVEFHFVPLAALVLLTPARQRVGDLIAGTVVIQLKTPETSGSTDDGPSES